MRTTAGVVELEENQIGRDNSTVRVDAQACFTFETPESNKPAEAPAA